MKSQISLDRRRRIGRNLRNLRWEYRLNQDDIAGITPQAIYNHEHGMTIPGLYAIECYIKCYGLEAVEKALEWR